MNKQGRLLLSLILLLVFTVPRSAEEGMWPIHEIGKLDLPALGFKVSAAEIFTPGQTSLTDAIVNLSGGTGSFVSDRGLIITNHHVAFSAIQRASSVEKDYLTRGFLAESLEAEVPALGFTARIIESCRDVSPQILGRIRRNLDYAARTRIIDSRIKKMILQAEKENPGKRAEVAEMFPGKTYMLFLYTYLRDVRLVYAPPLSIGNFGGETDNWVWPRHTGDFTFLRAYVAPDGSPADYSPDNVPYKPRTFLKIAAGHLGEGDRVFILGYPGRTYRHRTASFLAFEENLRLPYVADINEWQIREMEKRAQGDPELTIRFSSRIKGLANTMKNFRSKLVGLQRLNWTERKREEEKELAAFIAADPGRARQYGDVIPKTDAIYREMSELFPREIFLEQLPRVLTLFQAARFTVEGARELRKKDLERDSAYMDRNIARSRERMMFSLRNFDAGIEALFLAEMIRRASELPQEMRIPAFDRLAGKDAAALREMVESSVLANPDAPAELMKQSPAELAASGDPFISLALSLQALYDSMKEAQERRKGQLDVLAARLSEVREAWLQTGFIPDANGTLRLTFGSIRGYNPADAVYYKPFTTIAGILEKEGQGPEFELPEKIRELHRQREFGPYLHPDLDDVPVAMLYDMDTTGGNSGSPVLDAQGRLVGVNFDRALEATINDFVWNTSYSRSIAVDIRFVLWVARYLGLAENLLAELNQ